MQLQQFIPGQRVRQCGRHQVLVVERVSGNTVYANPVEGVKRPSNGQFSRSGPGHGFRASDLELVETREPGTGMGLAPPEE